LQVVPVNAKRSTDADIIVPVLFQRRSDRPSISTMSPLRMYLYKLSKLL
jgi:hypothetical protein